MLTISLQQCLKIFDDQGKPHHLQNRLKINKNDIADNSLTNSRWTALAEAHVYKQMYTLQLHSLLFVLHTYT